jgi:hypothetical protein
LSTQPPTLAPAAADPKAGLAVKTAIFRRNAKAAGWDDGEITEFTETFQTVSDVEMAMDLFKGHLPAEIKDKENALVKEKLQLKKAGTPPSQLPGSKGETQPLARLNSKSVENMKQMNFMKGAIPALRFNAASGEYEVI